MSNYELPGWEGIPLSPEAQAELERLTSPEAVANSSDLVEYGFYQNPEEEIDE